MTSDLNDLIKVPSGTMGYGPGIRGGEVNSRGRGEGDGEWVLVCADPVFVFEPCICKIQYSLIINDVCTIC